MLSEEVVVALALGIPSLVAAILALFVAYLTYRKAADTRVDRLAPWLPIMLAGVLPSSAPSALPTHAQTPRRGYDSSSEESARAAMPPLNQTMPARPVHHDVDVPSWRLLSRSTASSTQQQPHHQIATRTCICYLLIYFHIFQSLTSSSLNVQLGQLWWCCKLGPRLLPTPPPPPLGLPLPDGTRRTPWDPSRPWQHAP